MPTTPSGATARSWASGSVRWRACCCLSLYRELKHEAEAEAAREAAAHTLTPGAVELPETGEQNETTEDKGETENG